MKKKKPMRPKCTSLLGAAINATCPCIIYRDGLNYYYYYYDLRRKMEEPQRECSSITSV